MIILCWNRLIIKALIAISISFRSVLYFGRIFLGYLTLVCSLALVPLLKLKNIASTALNIFLVLKWSHFLALTQLVWRLVMILISWRAFHDWLSTRAFIAMTSRLLGVLLSQLSLLFLCLYRCDTVWGVYIVVFLSLLGLSFLTRHIR